MSDLADKTLQKVRDALSEGEQAGVPEVIKVIQELSARAFSVTVKELADLISRDVAVTAKVISAANTVGYNPWGIPVSTVSRAIQVIGFERVRNLALSLLLAENASRTQSEEQREAAALALQSGFLAQEIAKQSGSILSPEQAFICASLRNYGKLLMTTFLLREYRQAREIQRETGSDDAYREVFGLTPLELGYNLLMARNMPESILKSLQDLPPELIEKTAKGDEDAAYLAVADLSVRIGELTIDGDISAGDFEAKVDQLVGRYKKVLPGGKFKVAEVVKQTEREMKKLQRSFGIRSLSPRVLDSLACRVAERDIPPQPTAPRSPTESAASPASAKRTEPPFGEDKVKLDEKASAGREGEVSSAIEEITRRMGERSITFGEAIGVLLKAVHRQIGATDTILFLRDRQHGYYVPRLGHGPLFSLIEKTGTISPGERDVFGISINRLEDVFVENAKDPKIARYLPTWLRRKVPNLRSFLLLPLQENSSPYGLIWSGSTGAHPVAVTSTVLRDLRALRTHVTTVKHLKPRPPKAGTGA